MKRKIVNPGAIPQDTDILDTNKNTMIGLAFAMQAILGSSTAVDGLACTPTGPASMQVLVAPGSIYALANTDATGYGTLDADTTHSILKQGISYDTLTLTCAAPGTVGQSVVYLVQAAFQEVDTVPVVQPYYNVTDPSTPYSGPGNSGDAQNTIRDDQCVVTLKTGVAATTGSQTTPSADAGFVPLWAITVANGDTTVTSGKIAVASGAPFLSNKLPAMTTTAYVDGRTGSSQLFSAAGSATFTAPANTKANTLFKFRLLGGGGGGGGTGNSAWSCASGGGSGTPCFYNVTGLTAGQTVAINVGAGGTAGTGGGSPTNGGTGGSTTITVGAVTVTAPGGLGGVADNGDGAIGAAGGAISTNGTSNFTGTPSTFSFTNGTTFATSSNGAPSPLFGGGGLGSGLAGAGQPGTNPGSGGAGACNGSSGATTGAAGGTGAVGAVTVDWYN